MALVQLQVSNDQLAAIIAAGAVVVTQESPVEATSQAANCEFASAGRSTTPLFRVRYQSKRSGEVDTYGVFWHGRKDGVERYGLKPLVAGGHRMYRFNWRNSFSKGFFVNADECTRV